MTVETKTVLLDPVFQVLLDVREEIGVTKLGLTANQLWHHDPRHLLFLLSRYKFVSKMLSGKKAVLEVGCGDAFGTRLVLQEVARICAIDIEPIFVNDVNERMGDHWRFDCRVHDMLAAPVEGEFDAAYSLDVLEHIPPEKEHRFLSNICQSLGEHGVLILGTPSIQSQVHASEPSRQGHINCKDHNELKKLVSTYFHNVFIFSMNDEVVHTGFYPMAHYLFAVGAGKKNQ